MLYDTCYSYLVLFSNAVYTCFLSCALTHSSIVHVITFFGTLGLMWVYEDAHVGDEAFREG